MPAAMYKRYHASKWIFVTYFTVLRAAGEGVPADNRQNGAPFLCSAKWSFLAHRFSPLRRVNLETFGA
jgi:hypothetical protein